MKKKYYAVRRGRVTGIFATWAECKKQVEHYSNCEYAGFSTLDDALEFLGDVPDNTKQQTSDCAKQHTQGIVPKSGDSNLLTGEKAMAIAYVDGSYNAKTKRFAYGAVIFHAGREIQLSNSYFDAELSSMHNVAGEILGAQAVMQWCIEQGITYLRLFYDYEGIEKWCTGKWKANKNGTQAYRDYYKSLSDKLFVEFVKVKGHSGDKYNDMADQLAKSAAGIK